MDWAFFAVVLLFALGVLLFTTYSANGHVVTWSRGLENRRIWQGALRLIHAVSGRRGGRELRLTTARGGRHRLAVEAPNIDGLSFRDSGLFGGLRRLRRAEQRFLDRFAVVAEGRGTRLLEDKSRDPGAELEARLADALAAARVLRVSELRFEDGWLIAHGIQSFEASEALALTDAMIALAEAFSGAAAIGARVRAVSRDLRVCPFCRDALDEETRACEDCQAVHHQACWDEHGGCSIFGCRGAAPPSQQRAAVG